MSAILRQINIISRCAGQFRADKLQSEEIAPCHHSYALAICGSPGITAEELAKRLCVNKSSVARNLSYLEERGYIKREQSKDDKRLALCYPTEKLKNILPDIIRIIEEWNSFITEELSPEESRQFEDILGRIANKARSYVSGEEKECD